MASRALTRQEAARRASLLTNLELGLHLDLTDPLEAVSDVTLRFDWAEPGRGTFLDADLPVLDAQVNGRSVRPDAVRDGRLATGPLEPANVVRVSARVPHRSDGAGLHGFTDPEDGARYLHTKFQPFDAHRVFACFDQPDIKSSVELAVTAPRDWHVVANGAVVSHAADAGAAQWRFAPTPPLPAYLVSTIAGPFSEVRRREGATDCGLHVRPSLLSCLDPEELFELTFTGLRWYEELFGRSYAYGPSYDIAFVPEYGFGAMEHPGCVTVNERFVFRARPTAEQRRRRAEVLLHEMAHMWFGNLVSIRWWDDLWLSESFATLLASLAQAEATTTGATAWAMFAADAKAKAREADQLPSTHPIASEVPDTGAVRLQFDPITYRKGASLLRQLFAELGLPHVIDGLRRYLDRHEHGAADRADFLAALSVDGSDHAHAGRPSDLDAWSAQWLGTTGVDAVNGRPDSSGGILVERVPCATSVRGRIQPLTVAWFGKGDDRLVPLGQLAIRLGDDPVTIDAGAGVDVVLPNADDACYLKVVLDPRSTDMLLSAVSSIADPVARAVAWGALWDAVLDARLPAARFITAVSRHALSEPVPGLAGLLLERAERAAWMYSSDPVGPDGSRARLAAWAAGAIGQLPPGGDLQRALVKLLARTCLEPASVAAASALTRGQAVPELTEFVDLRWHLVVGLCRTGAADDEQIAAALAQDPSDEGQRQAVTARAARPSAAAKAEAWRIITAGDGSLATRRAVLEGWASPGQHDLLTPYIGEFFAALGRIWEEHGVEAGIAFTRGAFPHHVSCTDRVAALADQAIADAALPEPCRRLLAEEATRLRNDAAARARDARP